MKFNDLFYKQSRLLINVLPYVSEEACFALKGGTAINFFIQNMPRLSVDIDLAFLPILPREQSLTAINLAMQRIGQKIQSHFPEVKIAIDVVNKNVVLPKLFVRQRDVEIKVEVNPICRGSIFAPEIKSLCSKAQTIFESFLEMPLNSTADIYAGKFCAALNRQHPRDLYDVQLFMGQQGIPENVRQAFVIYLACDRRPIHELLLPNIKPHADQEKIFHSEFSGMVVEPIEYRNLAGVVNDLSSVAATATTFGLAAPLTVPVGVGIASSGAVLAAGGAFLFFNGCRKGLSDKVVNLVETLKDDPKVKEINLSTVYKEEKLLTV